MALLFLGIYLVVLTIITWRSSRKQSVSEYLNSSKSLSAADSTWTTFASLLTGYNFVLGVTFSYLYGLWYLISFLGAAGSFVVLYFLYKHKLLALHQTHNLFSLGDYFGVVYGPLTKNFVNIIFCLGLVLFLTLQMYVNTTLFSTLLNISKGLALLLTSGIVCAYLWFGGFKASVKTDIFQGFLMLPIILTVFIVPFNFSPDKISSVLDPNQLGFAIGLAVLQFLGLLAQPESFQRVFAAKDLPSLKKGLSFAFILLALIAGSIAYLGINFKLGGINIDPANLFTEGVLAILPSWLESLLIVSLIAAFMGTTDSSAFALGTLLTRFRHQTSPGTIKHIRLFTLAGIIISALASLYLFSFLSSVFALISLISIIGGALTLSLLIKLSATEINLFLGSGVITFILGLLFKFVTDNPLTSLIPIGVGLLTIILFRTIKGSRN